MNVNGSPLQQDFSNLSLYRKALARLSDGLAVNASDYQSSYIPLEWHKPVLTDTSPVILLTGSAGGGKTRLGGELAHRFMLRYPGATGLLLRKAREWATKSIVPFMRKTVISRDPRVRYKKSDSLFEYANGGVLYWGGLKDDEQRESIRSIGQDGALDFVLIEEANAFTLFDYEELLARMRGKAAPYVQLVLMTNPDSPNHWIYQRLILAGEATVYTSSAWDNPYNPPQYFEFLDKLTGVRRQRLRDGKWVQTEGAVFDNFDANIHVKDPFPIPADWPRYRIIDFGYNNPFTCQWWALSPDDVLVMYRELYMSNRIVEDHARDINRLSTGEEYIATIADHDAEDRATLQRYGIKTTAAIKDVTTGIQSVINRLAKAGNDKPRLLFQRNTLVERDLRLAQDSKPTTVLEEIDGYKWPQASDGKPVKEDPVKVNDHGCDCVRYLCRYFERPKAEIGFTLAG